MSAAPGAVAPKAHTAEPSTPADEPSVTPSTDLVTVQAGDLTRTEAERLTDLAGRQWSAFADTVDALVAGRAWVALGFTDWDTFAAERFADLRRLRLDRDDRRGIVVDLRSKGLSTRAIGSAIGVDQKTVVNDLRATEEHSSVDLPAKVISLDGRTRPVKTGRTTVMMADDELVGAVESAIVGQITGLPAKEKRATPRREPSAVERARKLLGRDDQTEPKPWRSRMKKAPDQREVFEAITGTLNAFARKADADLVDFDSTLTPDELQAWEDSLRRSVRSLRSLINRLAATRDA